VDPKFKQRLTGAVILILLAVLLVPELLTGPKAPPPGPVSSALSPAQSEGAPLRSYDIDLSDAPDASPPAAPVPTPAAPTPKAAPSAAAANPRTAAVTPGTAASPQPAAPPAADAMRADAGPAMAAAAAAATAPALRGFAVQVGSFASRDSADRLAADLDRRRFETFVSPVRSGGRQLYRVRVGPVADRTAAQTLQGRLKATGQKGSVVRMP